MGQIERHGLGFLLWLSWFLATDVVAQTVPIPQASSEVLAYRRSLDVLWVARQAVALAFPLILLFTGYAAIVASRLEAATHGRKWASWSLATAAYLAIATTIDVPLRLVGRALAPGVENQRLDVSAWVAAWVPEVLTSATIGLLLGGLVYFALKKSPRLWWIWAGSGALIAAFLFLVTEPYVTTYRPITTTDVPFKESIIRTAARAGIPANAIGIRQGDGTACGAGGVIGLGPTRLLLLDENLITAHTENQVLSTVGHEAKHFALDDNRMGFLILCLLVPAAFLVVRTAAQTMVQRWSAHFGFNELIHPGALPLLSFCLGVVMFALTPVWTQVHRHVESEADRFGLEMVQQSVPYAQMIASEQKCYNLDPEEGWFRRLFRNDHPAVGERIRFANSYRPWATGQALIYGAQFEAAGAR